MINFRISYTIYFAFFVEILGAASVDYIQSVPEPHGTDRPLPSVDIGSSAIGEKTLPSLPAICGPKKKKKIETYSDSKDSQCWQQDFLDHLKDTDEPRTTAELKIFDLKEYNLVLRNMELERNLGN